MQSCQPLIQLRTPAALSIEVDARRWNVWRENLETAPPRYISVELKECINAIFWEIWGKLRKVVGRFGLSSHTGRCRCKKGFRLRWNPLSLVGRTAR